MGRVAATYASDEMYTAGLLLAFGLVGLLAQLWLGPGLTFR